MKKSILSLLAVAAMASCTQNDMDSRGFDEQTEIKLTSSALSIDAAVTRAPFIGATIDATHKLKAKVVKSNISGNYSSDSGTSAYEGVMEFVDNAATSFETPQFYPVDPGTSVYLAGLYPENAAWTLDGTTKSVYNITVKGNEDLMFAKEVQTSKADALASPATYKELAFAHILTKLDVKLIAEDTHAKESWGKVKSITLIEAAGNQVNTDMTVNVTAGAAGISTTTAMVNSFPFYLVDNATSPVTYKDTKFNETDNSGLFELPVASTVDQANAEAKLCAYSLVAPFNMSGSTKTLKLKVVTENSAADGHDVTATVTLDVDNDGSIVKMQGKSLTITLVFKAAEIKATATVKDWADGGSANEEIQ